MMLMSLAKLIWASLEIDSHYSRQLSAMEMMSLLRSRCCDFSFVKMSKNDLMSTSLSSEFESSATFNAGVLERLKIVLCIGWANVNSVVSDYG